MTQYLSYAQKRRAKKKEQERQRRIHVMFTTAPCVGCGDVRMSFARRAQNPLCTTADLQKMGIHWRTGCYEKLVANGSINLDPLGSWKIVKVANVES